MKKTDELKKAIAAKHKELDELRQASTMDDALKAADELNRLVDEYKIASSLEAEELLKVKETGTPVESGTEPKEVLRNRAFNKLVLKMGELTESERRAYCNDGSGTTISPALVEGTAVKGGYLVPTEQIATIREYRQQYPALKEYCHVVTANSLSGTWPTMGASTRRLIKFNEMNRLSESTLEFSQAEYRIDDYGLVCQVSNQLLSDVNVNLLGIIGQDFARSAVATENDAIIALMETLTPTALTGYKGLMRALTVDLDPVFFADCRIITSQSGMQWLNELTDGQNRPLLVPDVAQPDTFRFRGKEIVVLSDDTLPTKNNKIPFYVGSLSEYCLFFEKQGLEIAVSTDYGFAQYATMLRCVHRFDVAVDDPRAIKAYQVTVT